ncbi:hypothetical protein VOLCADRAFT_100420, partial [Volvox carteri f. nagariensis]
AAAAKEASAGSAAAVAELEMALVAESARVLEEVQRREKAAAVHRSELQELHSQLEAGYACQHRANAENADLQVAQRTAQEQLVQLSAQLTAARRELESLYQERQQLHTDHAQQAAVAREETAARLAAAHQETNSLRVRLTEEQADQQRLRAELQAAEQEARAAKEHLAAAQATHGSLEVDLEDLQQQLLEARDARVEVQSQLAGTECEKAVLAERARQLRLELNEQAALAQQAEARAVKADADLEEVQRQLLTARGELGKLAEALATAEATLSEREAELQRLWEELKSLEGTHLQVREEAQARRVEAEAAALACAGAEARAKAAESACAETEARAEAAEAACVEAEAALFVERSKAADLEAEMQVATRRMVELQKVVEAKPGAAAASAPGGPLEEAVRAACERCQRRLLCSAAEVVASCAAAVALLPPRLDERGPSDGYCAAQSELQGDDGASAPASKPQSTLVDVRNGWTGFRNRPNRQVAATSQDKPADIRRRHEDAGELIVALQRDLEDVRDRCTGLEAQLLAREGELAAVRREREDALLQVQLLGDVARHRKEEACGSGLVASGAVAGHNSPAADGEGPLSAIVVGSGGGTGGGGGGSSGGGMQVAVQLLELRYAMQKVEHAAEELAAALLATERGNGSAPITNTFSTPARTDACGSTGGGGGGGCGGRLGDAAADEAALHAQAWLADSLVELTRQAGSVAEQLEGCLEAALPSHGARPAAVVEAADQVTAHRVEWGVGKAAGGGKEEEEGEGDIGHRRGPLTSLAIRVLEAELGELRRQFEEAQQRAAQAMEQQHVQHLEECVVLRADASQYRQLVQRMREELVALDRARQMDKLMELSERREQAEEAQLHAESQQRIALQLAERCREQEVVIEELRLQLDHMAASAATGNQHQHQQQHEEVARGTGTTSSCTSGPAGHHSRQLGGRSCGGYRPDQIYTDQNSCHHHHQAHHWHQEQASTRDDADGQWENGARSPALSSNYHGNCFSDSSMGQTCPSSSDGCCCGGSGPADPYLGTQHALSATRPTVSETGMSQTTAAAVEEEVNSRGDVHFYTAQPSAGSLGEDEARLWCEMLQLMKPTEGGVVISVGGRSRGVSGGGGLQAAQGADTGSTPPPPLALVPGSGATSAGGNRGGSGSGSGLQLAHVVPGSAGGMAGELWSVAAAGAASTQGRAEMLARAVSHMSLLHAQNNKLARLLKGLAARRGAARGAGAVVEGLTARLQLMQEENSELWEKYHAAQLAQKTGEQAMRRMGQENRQLHTQLMGLIRAQTGAVQVRSTGASGGSDDTAAEPMGQ